MGAGNYYPQFVDEYEMLYVDFPSYEEYREESEGQGEEPLDLDSFYYLWNQDLESELISAAGEDFAKVPKANWRDRWLCDYLESNTHYIGLADNQWAKAVVVYYDPRLIEGLSADPGTEEMSDAEFDAYRAAEIARLHEETERIFKRILDYLYNECGYDISFRAGPWQSRKYKGEINE